MRAFPPPRWGREGSSENQLRLWTSSRKRFFFFFFYYCFVIPPRESDLIDLKGEPMERSSVCPGVEGGVSVLCCLSCYVVSDSSRPQGLWPTRLPCPWDFPGKNTGVGCHFLLQGVVLSQGLKLHLLLWQVGSLPLSH